MISAAAFISNRPMPEGPVMLSSTPRAPSMDVSSSNGADPETNRRTPDVSDSSKPQRATDASRGDDDELELAIDEIAVALSRAWLF